MVDFWDELNLDLNLQVVKKFFDILKVNILFCEGVGKKIGKDEEGETAEGCGKNS